MSLEHLLGQGTKLESWVSKEYKTLGQGWKYNVKWRKEGEVYERHNLHPNTAYGKYTLVRKFEQGGPSGRCITIVKLETLK